MIETPDKPKLNLFGWWVQLKKFLAFYLYSAQESKLYSLTATDAPTLNLSENLEALASSDISVSLRRDA